MSPSGLAPSIFSPLAPLRCRFLLYESDGPTLYGIHRRILAEDFAHRVRDFPQRAPSANRVDDRRHQVAAVTRRRLDSRERFGRRVRVAFRTHARDARLLLLLELRLDPQNISRRFTARSKLVDPDDDSLLRFNLALVNECRVLNFALHVTTLDRRDRAAEVVDLRKILDRLLFQLVREPLDVVRAA